MPAKRSASAKRTPSRRGKSPSKRDAKKAAGSSSSDSDGEGSVVGLPIPNEDLTATRREYLVAPPAFIRTMLLSIMNDKADLPLVYLLLNILCTVPLGAYGIFSLPTIPYGEEGWWIKPALGAAYTGFVLATFLQRFVLMLHFSEHRPVFKGLLAPILNNLNPLVVAPFMGIPSGMYYLHHVIMHHIENNVFPYDVSSTMPYQRDSFLHFMHYWTRFTFASWVELPYYAYYRGRYKLAVGSICCAVCYWTGLYQFYQYDWQATLFVWILPFVVVSFALMFGNWSQHIFVDPEDPYSNYKLTYNLMNTPENQFTFNDGYHINHHIHSRLHWTQLPQRFCDQLETFAKNDAFLFTGLGFFDVGLYCVTGQLERLAKHYVHYGQVQRSEKEIVEEFKRRLVPIPED